MRLIYLSYLKSRMLSSKIAPLRSLVYLLALPGHWQILFISKGYADNLSERTVLKDVSVSNHNQFKCYKGPEDNHLRAHVK